KAVEIRGTKARQRSTLPCFFGKCGREEIAYQTDGNRSCDRLPCLSGGNRTGLDGGNRPEIDSRRLIVIRILDLAALARVALLINFVRTIGERGRIQSIGVMINGT